MIGKTVNYATNSLKKSSYTLPVQQITTPASIQDLNEKSSNFVMSVLIEEYDLYWHLQNLNRFMMLSQGDFITHLVSNLSS